MKWGCHSFGGIHAIFAMYGGSSITNRIEIIKQVITKRGIIGFVYSSNYGVSSSIEKEIDSMGNYGIVHGGINCEQHNYYRDEDTPLDDELTAKLKNDVKYFERRQKEITAWYEWNNERLQLALNSTKDRLNHSDNLVRGNLHEKGV